MAPHVSFIQGLSHSDMGGACRDRGNPQVKKHMNIGYLHWQRCLDREVLGRVTGTALQGSHPTGWETGKTMGLNPGGPATDAITNLQTMPEASGHLSAHRSFLQICVQSFLLFMLSVRRTTRPWHLWIMGLTHQFLGFHKHYVQQELPWRIF